MRYPAVAGAFYERDAGALRAEVESCFKSPLGPGRVPGREEAGKRRRIRGVVVPHAGLMYSGPFAAHSYMEIWKDGLPDVFVVIGPNHYATSPTAALSTGDFMTPLGKAEVDAALSEKMRGGLLEFDDVAQASEHSIEVQLPFLKYMDDDVRFVPICMGAQDYESARRVGERVRKAVEGVDAVVVASSDFSHYITPEEARKKDMVAIERILANDPEGLYEAVIGRDISMCGYGPVMAMLCAVDFQSATMLAYGHSGLVRPMHEVVAYCSIKIEGK